MIRGRSPAPYVPGEPSRAAIVVLRAAAAAVSALWVWVLWTFAAEAF